MDRKQTTKLLTDILIADKLSDRKYYAKEVTLDYGTEHSKRIDVVQFVPKGVVHASDIEKGIFVCYEIKSCVQDVYSGNGLNFYGEKNYLVLTMDTYKALTEDFRMGKFQNYLTENYPESSHYYGVLVAVPASVDIKNAAALFDEFEHPSEFKGETKDWKLYAILPCREGSRSRSSTEMLFCMLRSKHNYTNLEVI